MPRPKNKNELIAESQGNYYKLVGFISNLTEKEQKRNFKKGTLNRNIRDVLAHLYHWHLLFLRWYEVGMSDQKPKMPAEDYTWKMTPELNKAIRDKYKNAKLDDIKILFGETFANIQALIKKHSNKELFEKRYYKWTGSTSLGSYLISATSSHYDWALKLIQKSRV